MNFFRESILCFLNNKDIHFLRPIRVKKIIIIFVSLSFLFSGCKKESSVHFKSGFVSNGVLDLRGIDLNFLEPFPLAGVWEAFPSRLPKTLPEFLALENETPIPLAIPGYWINQNLPANGYITYRLKLLVEEPGNLMIYLREASSAYKLFSYNSEVGLIPLGESGRLATNKEEGIGYYQENARSFPIIKGSIIYLQVSNYLYSRGGPYYSPLLGGSAKTLTYLRFKERKKLFFVGVFFLLALYHIVLFLHRRKEKYTILFALLCLAWLARMILFERLTRNWFEPSDLMEMIQIRMEYLNFIFVEFFSIMFFLEFFSSELNKRIKKFLLTPVIVFFLVTLLTPYSVYTKLLQVTQVYMVFILGFSFYAVVRYIKKKETRYDGIVFMLGSVSILFTSIFDILVFLNRWELPLLTDYGFAFYSLCLAVVISSRNSHAWETAEYLTLNLRNEVEWKTNELRREKEKVEKESELKDKFISIVSHDIRSPLFGISSVVNLLTEDPPSLSPEKTRQVLVEASSGLKNLLSMVEDLIQYSRFQNVTVFPDYQLFDYLQLVDTLIEKAEPFIDAKKITIITEIKESSVGIGDPNLIQHLLWNLIINAIKFTPNGGRLKLSLKEEDKQWCFSVEDSGIGIPEYWKERIFEDGFLFMRKGTNEEFGTGVGLAFCKEVSDRHGAKLEVSSVEGSGSIFKFILPNFEKVVLILDDNPGYRSHLRKILKNIPCIIWEEEVADHAIRSILKVKPDLIIIDFAMPEKTGIEFLRELYENPDMVEIRSLLLSSSLTDPNTGKKLEKDVIAVGGDAFLRKTVSEERMVAEIARLLSLN